MADLQVTSIAFDLDQTGNTIQAGELYYDSGSTNLRYKTVNEEIRNVISDAQLLVTSGDIQSNVITYAQNNINLTTISGVLEIAKGGTNNSTPLNNNRVMISSAGAIVENAAITANRVLVSDINGIPAQSITTSTEVSYLNGTTSNVQTQLNTLNTSIINSGNLLNATKQPLDATLTALAAYNTNGFVVQTAADTFVGRTITAGSGIIISNGDGVSNNTVISSTMANYSETTSATTNTTNSTTDTLLTNSITGTPSAGTWLITFSCSMGNNGTTGARTFVNLYKGPSGSTTKVANTERSVKNGSGSQAQSVIGSASFQTIQTFNGTDIFEIRWRVSGGTSTIYDRTLTAIKIG